jgi:hypothetical protein
MRIQILAVAVVGGLLAQAGAAVAQSGMTLMGQAPSEAYRPVTQMAPMPTQHDRYLMKLANLRDRTIRTKAKDGGQLTPDHAAGLQRELDALNHQFGVTAG